MRIEKVFVTPAMAEEWLAKRWKNQRPLDEQQVQRIMADLVAGTFYFGPQMIVFDMNDHMGDGQHRLEACRRCGVGFQTLVAFDVDSRVLPKLGQAKGWSLAAILNLHDEMRQFGAQHAVHTAASVGSFLFKQLTGKVRKPTDDEALAVLLHFRDSILWSLDACSTKAISKVSVRSAFVIMHSARPATFEIFADKTRTGAGLERNDPALTLRDYLLSESVSADTAPWQFYKVLRAGEAYQANEKLHKLQSPRDSMGAIRAQMDVFLGSSMRLAERLGLFVQPAPMATNARVDGARNPVAVFDDAKKN